MSKTFANGDKIYHVELNNMVDAHNENGVLVGLEISAQGTPSLTLDIDTGQCYINNETYVESSVTTVVIGTGVGLSNPRIDMVCYNPTTNSAIVIPGISNVAPKPSDIPQNNILLALIHISVGDSVIQSGQISDERIFVKPVGVIYLASNALIASDDVEESHSMPFYSKEKEIVIMGGIFSNDSIFRIVFDLKSGVSGEYVNARIYRNGSSVGYTRSRNSDVYYTYSQDITGWSAGDLIQLYTNSGNASHTVYVQNFRVYGDIKAISVYNW